MVLFPVPGHSMATGVAFPVGAPAEDCAFNVAASRSLAVGGIAHSLAKLKFCNPKRVGRERSYTEVRGDTGVMVRGGGGRNILASRTGVRALYLY